MTAARACLVLMEYAVTSEETRAQASVRLAGAYQTLESSLAGSVGAVTFVLPLDGRDGSPAVLRDEAERVAEMHHLAVEVSANGTHMRVRFSRRAGA